MLDCFTYKGKALSYIKSESTRKIRAFLASRARNIEVVQKKLRSVQNSIPGTEEKYLRQANIAEAVYKKVTTSLKVQETGLQRNLAELHCNAQWYWDKYDLIVKGIEDVPATYNLSRTSSDLFGWRSITPCLSTMEFSELLFCMRS